MIRLLFLCWAWRRGPDGVAVGAALGRVDELVGQAHGDQLDVAEGGLAGAGAQQPDSLPAHDTS